MGNRTTTLQGEILLESQFELVTVTTVAGTLYGIAFTLFCLYVHSLVPRLRDGDRKRQARFMLGYSSVVMLCGLYILVGEAWVTQNAYVKHSSYPGGPFSYEVSTYRTPPIIVGLACQLAVDVLTSAVQIKIWRVWVIWSATRYSYFVIALPLLCLFTWTGLNLRLVILDATVSIAKIKPLAGNVELESLFQAVDTILCTALISVFLVVWHRRQRKLMGTSLGSAGYMKIVAILIESYALESIWVLLSAGILTTSESVTLFFNESKYNIEIIAYLLVQYRIANGKAFESQREQSKISSLHWNHSNHAATTESGETGELEAGGDHNVSAKPPAVALDVLPASSPA